MSNEKHIFAVCDTEFEYACSFMEYLNQKRTIPFEVHAFTDPEELLRFAEKNPLDILLISERALRDEIRKVPIRQIMILSEGSGNPELEAYPSIYKYQSSDQVIREVLSCYGKSASQAQSALNHKRGKQKVLGVYSPTGQSGKTTLALAMGLFLAREKNVLYMNLEGYSALPEFFSFPSESGLSEVLYYAKQEKKGTVFRLRGMTTAYHQMDILPPVQNPEDLLRTSGKEWSWLLSRLEEESNYEIILLDIGENVGEVLHVLSLCDRIYLPIRDDTVGRIKIRKFLEFLEEQERSELAGKIHQVSLPALKSRQQGRLYYEELIWNSTGEAVQELLRSEGLL